MFSIIAGCVVHEGVIANAGSRFWGATVGFYKGHRQIRLRYSA